MPAWGQTRDSSNRGYEERDCGFDLDDDGIVGEASDDCDFANGQSGTGAVTSDIDGDGDDETTVYVDCDSGTDSTGRGGPSDPYLTLEYALGDASHTDELVVAFKGTCDITTPVESLQPGGGTVRTLTPDSETGHEWDRKRCADNGIITGWDADGDGVFPPKDSDDVSVITNSTDSKIFYLREGDSCLEWAHFTQDEASNNTFFHPSTSSGSAGTNYLYVHDLELTDLQDADWWSLNRSSCDGGTSYVEIDNLWLREMTDTAVGAVAFILRGNPTNCAGNSRYYTVSHVSIEHSWSTGEGVINLFDAWGSEAEGHTVEHSKLYIQIVGNRTVVDQTGTGMPNTALGTIAQGSSFWVVRNNFVDGANSGVVVEHSDTGFTAGDPMTDLVIDRNEFWLMADQNDKDTFCVNVLDDGGNADNTLVDLTISNNVCWCRDAGKPTDRGTAFYFELGLDSTIPEGHFIRIEGNTVDGCERQGFLWVNDQGRPSTFDVFEVHGNVASDLDSLNIDVDYDATGWNGSNNSWDSTTNGFYFAGANRTLAVMKSTYGEASNSTECSPIYTSSGTGDFSLDGADTCARGQGAALTNPYDLRGNLRAAPYDRGALAYTAGAPATERFLPFVK